MNGVGNRSIALWEYIDRKNAELLPTMLVNLSKKQHAKITFVTAGVPLEEVSAKIIELNFQEKLSHTWTITHCEQIQPRRWELFKQTAWKHRWQVVVCIVFSIVSCVLFAKITVALIYGANQEIKDSKEKIGKFFDYYRRGDIFPYKRFVEYTAKDHYWTCVSIIKMTLFVNIGLYFPWFLACIASAGEMTSTYHSLKEAPLHRFTVIKTGSSLAEIDVENLANEKEDDDWLDVISRDLIKSEEIRSPKMLLIGNYAFNILDCVKAMLMKNIQTEGTQVKLPHPIEDRFLSEYEQKKFLHDVSTFFCCTPEALMNVFTLTVSEEEADLIAREEISYWDELHRADKKPTIDSIIKSCSPIKKINNARMLFQASLLEDKFQSFNLKGFDYIRPPIPDQDSP